MSEVNSSLSLANPHPANYNGTQKLGLALIAIGVLSLALAWVGIGKDQALYFFIAMLAGLMGGGLIYFYGTYGKLPAGIKNNRVFFLPSPAEERWVGCWVSS